MAPSPSIRGDDDDDDDKAAPVDEHREHAHNDGNIINTTTTGRDQEETRLVRKLDCFLAPVLMLLMLLSYLYMDGLHGYPGWRW